MLYMNGYEVAEVRLIAERSGWSVTLQAVEILERLIEWANQNSDGWAYWPLPARAASQLMERLVEQRKKFFDATGYDLTYNHRDLALRPIKAFFTRQINAGRATESDHLWVLEGLTPAEVV